MEKVSVITACYNSEKFIEETIKSVLSQSYVDWEMIIVDDCSSDKSIDIIQNYMKRDNRIKLIRLEVNSGAGIARNMAIKAAVGKYIAFLDSDDIWKPDKLEKQICFMKEKDCCLSYSSYVVINEKGLEQSTVIAKEHINYGIMLKNNYIGCLTAVYDTQILGKVFMPEIRKRQDWALWLKILKKTDKAFGIKEPLAFYRDRNDSISANKFDLLKYNWAIYKNVEGFSTLKSIYFISQYLLIYIFFKK